MSDDNKIRDNERGEGEQPDKSESQPQLCLHEHEPLTDILSLIPHKVINYLTISCNNAVLQIVFKKKNKEFLLSVPKIKIIIE